MVSFFPVSYHNFFHTHPQRIKSTFTPGGRHSTEVAFALLTQQPWVRNLPRTFSLTVKLLLPLLSSWTVLRDRTHKVLKQGISQIQLAA